MPRPLRSTSSALLLANAAALLVTINLATGSSAADQPSPASDPRIVGSQAPSSAALVAAAWQALANKDFAAVAALTTKCREHHEAEARRQQGALTEIIPESQRERILAQAALNDVATCFWIAGQAMELQGDTPAAIDLYRKLKTQFRFAQCWDTKGWFWRPAESARTRLFHLELEAAAK